MDKCKKTAKQYFAFQWHITDDCDQRCKHCYIFSENNCKRLDSVSWEQMEEVVVNCEDFCKVYNRLPYFYITGGNPVLHPDFWKLLALLKDREIPFTILGNPFHLTDEVVLDMGKLEGQLSGVTKALELLGPKTLYDSLRCMEKGGIVCHTGILGGVYALNGFNPIKYIPNGVYLTGFYSNAPTQEVMDNMFSFIREHNLHPRVGAGYDFSDIKEACVALDGGKINGKIVIKMS